MKALGILLVWSVAWLNAAEYSVVVSTASGIERTDGRQLRDIFLQKRHFIGDKKVIPVNVLAENGARMAFESRIMKMERDTLNRYWVKQHFQGVSPPLTQPSFASVKRFVENVEGAVGYIPTAMVDERVRVLYEF